MAQVEPMDIDGMESDYEDKENSILHSNVLPKLPCTERGYEELDVSELNMKLRYSITPASSPLSRSNTGNCKDNKNIEDKNNSLNIGNADLSSSLNSTLTNNDINKVSKVYQMQTLPTDNLNDISRNVLLPKSLDNEDNNITITVSNNIDENFSIPSTSSSIPHTPEATTPTKELPKDGGSPIMRGLRSVLSMFKPQSPQPPHDLSSQVDLDPLHVNSTITNESELHAVQVSTPLHATNRSSPKRMSPLKDTLVFNDDLERELHWNNDSTIIFKEEKIPKHKLFLQESVTSNLQSKILNKTKEEGNKTLEYMDISYNDTIDIDKTMTDIETKSSLLEIGAMESDGEFVDCETTYTKDEIESLLQSKENISMHNSVQHYSIDTDVNTLDLTKNTCPLNLILPIDSSDLPACTSNDVINSKVSAKDIHEDGNLDSKNDLQGTFSLIHSKEISLCETELPVFSNMTMCGMMVNNHSASKIEVNNIDANEVSTHNVTDILKCQEEQIKDNTLVSHGNESCVNLYKIENKLECIEDCIDKISDPKINISMGENNIKEEAEEVKNIKYSDIVQFGVDDDDSKSKEAICINTSDIDPILSQTTRSTINEATSEITKSEAIDLINMENKLSEECNTEIKVTDFLLQTNNNSTESLEYNFGENNLNETLSQNNNIGIQKCAESSNEMDYSNNVKNELHSAKIILPISESLIKLPVDIPLPTDSDFDKDIIDICEGNNISSNIEYEVNEPVRNCKINTKEGLDISNKISNVLETVPIDMIIDEKHQNRRIAKEQEINKSVLSESEEKSNQIIEPINSNPVDCAIDEMNFSSKSLEAPNMCETFEIYPNEISKNNFSLQFNTKSNFQKLDEEICLNAEQSCNPFEPKNKLQISPPLSPSMSNRGYNIDFDDVQDPFATKTKIRQSPTPEIVGQISLATEVIVTRKVSPKSIKSSKRKSHPIRKPMNSKNNSLNTTFDCNIKKDCKTNIMNDDTMVTVKVDSTKEDTPDTTFDDDASVLRNTINTSVNKPGLENTKICIIDNKNEVLEHECLFLSAPELADPSFKPEPADSSPAPEPADPSPAPEPADPSTAPEHADSSPAPEPADSSPAPEPADSSPAPKPADSSPAPEPADSSPASESSNPFPALKPADPSSAPESADPSPAPESANPSPVPESANPSPALKPADPSPAPESAKPSPVLEFTEPSPAPESANPSPALKPADPSPALEPADPSSARDITKSVFNCPEINDINFCSYLDKQNTLPSDLMMPTGDVTFDNKEYTTQSKIDSLEFVSPEFIDDQLMPIAGNEISVHRDSKSSDIKEVNTEDEDTATFNETTELMENDKESSVKDLLAFEVSHTAIDSDNVDNDEMFIDAEAFEFLLNQNKTNVIADSGKESLFLKFDPLFTKRVSSDGIIAALKRVQNNQSTPKKLTKMQFEAASEIPGPSEKEMLDDVADDASIQATSKPMMVVNPAINSIVSPRKVVTPKVNRQSLTFTSPAMAVIDKLLSLSGNNLITDHNSPAPSPARQRNETDIAITQLREMLADKDIHVHNLRSESKELKDRLSSLEEQVKCLELESADRLKKVNDLNERLLEKTKMNKSMANVVEEYERTIASLITQIEQEKKNNAEERITLIKERDEQTAHLASMEVSFNDLHSKYEKSKQLIYSMKANEETYKKSIQEFEVSLSKMQNNYELLKQHATSKLNHANLELEKFNRAHEAEVLKLNARIKRKELHITSLEETLAQKTKANEELTAICDELINKVG